MNFKLFAVLAACCVVFQPANAQKKFDNRDLKPVTEIPFSLRDEVNTVQDIKRTKDEKLIQAIERDGFPLRLVWNQRISLSDADYVLCLFDSIDIRLYPGDNPRVLVLFDLSYKIKTYGFFTCEPPFVYGAIVQRFEHTHFVTVNASPRFGGALSFEKYLITPTAITKLGYSHELTKIPDSLPAADGDAARAD